MRTNYFLFLFFLGGCVPSAIQDQQNNPLQGAWKFHSFYKKDSSGKFTETFWMKNADGILLYDAHENMCIQITSPSFTSSKKDTLILEKFSDDPLIFTKGNYGYCGKYMVNNDSITHTKETSSNPSLKGTKSHKKYTLFSDTLYLYSQVLKEDYLIKWVKIKNSLTKQHK